MAETTRRADRSSESAGSTKIAVTNTHRTQPILFHFVGGSLRLGPLETGVLDRRCLASPELSHLIGTGAVKLAEAPAPARGGRREAEGASSEKAGGTAEDARPRTTAEPREG